MELYQRIRELRIAQNMSQEELAQKMGYRDRSTIAKIESGENDLTQSKIIGFAEALGVTPAYLMGWESKRPASLSDDRVKEIIELCDRLNPQNREKLLELAQLYIDHQQKQDTPRRNEDKA